MGISALASLRDRFPTIGFQADREIIKALSPTEWEFKTQVAVAVIDWGILKQSAFDPKIQGQLSEDKTWTNKVLVNFLHCVISLESYVKSPDTLKELAKVSAYIQELMAKEENDNRNEQS